MSALQLHLQRFRLRVDRLRPLFADIQAHPKAYSRLERFLLQEGLLSATWQAWSGLCRSLVMSSVSGSTTQSGYFTSSTLPFNNEADVGALAACAARNQQVRWPISPIAMFKEPTWGDPDKLLLIVPALRLTNEATLMTGLGSVYRGAKHLQRVRNACAHLNREQVADMKRLQVFYSSNRFVHPSDAILWIDPARGDFAWHVWLDELLIGAKAAIQ